jgi:hypothetical protein
VAQNPSLPHIVQAVAMKAADGFVIPDAVRDATTRKTTRDQGTLYQGLRSGSFGCHEEPGNVFGHAERLFSNCSASELSNCGKLLKSRRGEVAERLNAAVC